MEVCDSAGYGSERIDLSMISGVSVFTVVKIGGYDVLNECYSEFMQIQVNLNL